MGRITQEAYHRQRMMRYLAEHGNVTETAIRYKTSRKTVTKWRNRWDGTIQSLEDQSRRPKHSPRKHSEAETREIRRRLKKHHWSDLLLAYQEMVEHGYARSYGGFKRIAAQLKAAKPKRRKKRKPKPYQRADYPGQKIQLDVKYVPSYCVADGKKYYQFTAKDECSRWTYRQMYDEHSTYSAKEFLLELIRHAPFPVRMIQTDNGTEFTNALLVVKSTQKTLFEEALAEMGIAYKRIRIATPRHNGKVERQHRTDEARFYSRMRMYSLADGRRQLALYQRKSNDYIMTCLGLRSPNQVLEGYLAVM